MQLILERTENHLPVLSTDITVTLFSHSAKSTKRTPYRHTATVCVIVAEGRRLFIGRVR
jgi:hypothetical protein